MQKRRLRLSLDQLLSNWVKPEMEENLPINTEGVKPPSDGASAKFDADTETVKENTLRAIRRY